MLKRLVTGRWRSSYDRRPDVDTCRETLRAWAWSGATNDPVSDVGTWADDIPTGGGRLGKAEEEALNHVATPLRPADVDTGETLRRFIHRSMRERAPRGRASCRSAARRRRASSVLPMH